MNADLIAEGLLQDPSFKELVKEFAEGQHNPLSFYSNSKALLRMVSARFDLFHEIPVDADEHEIHPGI